MDLDVYIVIRYSSQTYLYLLKKKIDMQEETAILNVKSVENDSSEYWYNDLWLSKYSPDLCEIYCILIFN